jgi:hypothetical protein
MFVHRDCGAASGRTLGPLPIEKGEGGREESSEVCAEDTDGESWYRVVPPIFGWEGGGGGRQRISAMVYKS